MREVNQEHTIVIFEKGNQDIQKYSPVCGGIYSNRIEKW